MCYVKHCSAKVIVTDDKKCFYDAEHSLHCHGIQTSTYNDFKTEGAIKTRCMLEIMKPKEIYNEELRKNGESSVQFQKRKRNFNRLQSDKIPKSPLTMVDVLLYFALELISNTFGKTEDNGNLFYWETVSLKNFGYSIFISEKILLNLPAVRRFRIDGTFKCVPNGPFKQLLIISVDAGNHVRRYICIFIICFNNGSTALDILLHLRFTDS